MTSLSGLSLETGGSGELDEAAKGEEERFSFSHTSFPSP